MLIFPSIVLDLFEFQGHKLNLISLSNKIMSALYALVVITLFYSEYNILKYILFKDMK